MLAATAEALGGRGAATTRNALTNGEDVVTHSAYCESDSVFADETHIQATIGDDPGEIAPVRAAVHQLAERAGYAGRADDLALAIDELIANAQEHGAAPIHVVAEADDHMGVRVEVSDSGSGFDWAEAVREHPPLPDSRRGRGLWIVRQLVDRVTVERNGDDTTRIRIDVEQAA